MHRAMAAIRPARPARPARGPRLARGARPARVAAVALLALVACAGVLVLAAPSAHAGRWVQVSCLNPDGSAAPSEGWSGAPVANASGQMPGSGSWVTPRCSPGSPMDGGLSTATPDPVGVGESLKYQPPAGSTIVGGTLNVDAYAAGGGTGASANVYMFEPTVAWPNLIFQCTDSPSNCGATAHHFRGVVTLPSDIGGDLFVEADCTTNGTGNRAAECDSGGSDKVWSGFVVSEAHIDLSDAAIPTGTDFTGAALDRPARGTPHLVFTASDPSGPGVYRVTVSIDGATVWSGTPNTNSGACAPVGTEAGTGALMFDSQQPCPAAESVSVAVPTTSLPDGKHELTVAVTDAAGNVATVFDRAITTSNPQKTPKPRRGVKAQFELSWRWKRARTVLRSIKVHKLPSDGRVRIRCTGRHCPKLKVRSAPAKRVRTLLRGLDGRTFRAGDRLLITVSAPRRRAERIQLKIRAGREPTARLLKR